MHVSAFLAVAAVVVVTPGADMALVTKNALLHGRGAALATAVGINLGIAVWTVAAALGLAAVIAHSASAFHAVRLAGAVYLVWLGVQTLHASRRARTPVTTRAAPSGRVAFRQGLVSNLLNPKIAVFFTGLLPQFAGQRPGAADLLLLGALFNLLGLVWLVAYALAAARGRDVLRRPNVERAVSLLTGVSLVGLGVRLAFEDRR